MIEWIYDDGGRIDAGFKGSAGDCVTRAIAVASGMPYREVYDTMAELNQGPTPAIWGAEMSEIVQGTEHWDGTKALDFIFDDGGRADAGFKGRAGDCVARAVAIASERPYAEVYKRLAHGMGTQRLTKRRAKQVRSARNGVNVKRKWFRDYMAEIGFEWVPTMQIGSGCKVHLLSGELPMGRLIVTLSRHYTAVIDGVIHDTYDPTRATIITEGGEQRMSHRCVYGYWQPTA